MLPTVFRIEDVGNERIVDYIVYQIYRCRDAIVEGRWHPGWMFSSAAREKYRNQFIREGGKSGMNYYIDQWLDEHDLSRGELVKLIEDQKPSPLRAMVYMESEEPIKRRFYNTETGFALCQQATTGWSPLSECCKGCVNWIECGKLTAHKYPELMRYRKEAYGNEKKR